MQVFRRISKQTLMKNNREMAEQLRRLEPLTGIIQEFERQLERGYQLYWLRQDGGTVWYAAGRMIVYDHVEISLLFFQMEKSSPPERIGECDLIHRKRSLYIHRFEPSAAQKGYGSVMMEAILHFARRQNPIRQVSGWLAPGDLKSHGERLLHFYQKFGFSMTDLEEGKQITLDLS